MLAIPGASSSKSSTAPRPTKRKRARKDDDVAELEVSAEDLVAADGDEGYDDGDEEDGGRRARARLVGGIGDGEGDDEDEDESGGAAAVGARVKSDAKRRRDETLLLRSKLDNEQGRRFDAFRSVVIPRAAVKKLNRDLYDQHIPNNLTAVVAGMVKVFVADVVETAKELQAQSKYPSGPLKPYHLQLARIHLEERGLLSAPGGAASQAARSTTGLRARKPLFRR